MQWFRWLNIILSTAASWMFVATLLRRWVHMLWPERWVSLGFVGVLVSVGYGSAEALHQDVSLGFRVALMSSSLACLCIALAFDAFPHLAQTLRHQPAKEDRP